jgi:hypothetical protein
MAATADGMRMDPAMARSLDERGYLTIETASLGSGWAYARIMYGEATVWSCPVHSHKTTKAAIACATRQLKRIKKA